MDRGPGYRLDMNNHQIPSGWWSSPPRPHRNWCGGKYYDLILEGDGVKRDVEILELDAGELLLFRTLRFYPYFDIDNENKFSCQVELRFRGIKAWGPRSISFRGENFLPTRSMFWELLSAFEGPGRFEVVGFRESDTLGAFFNLTWDAWIIANPWRLTHGHAS